MASFIVLLAIVAHRFLRLDLLDERIARLHPPAVLAVLLALALGWDVLRGGLRLRAQALLMVQWALCGWAAVCKLVADGVAGMRAFVSSNYLKDVVFLTLVGVLSGTLERLRTLIWVFVAVMTFVAAVVTPQRVGDRRCYYYDYGRSQGLNYEQKTDGRPCLAAADCYELPAGEQHLRGMSWACERRGPLGLATVVERARYVGSMAEPNSMSLALVMGCALALGLATWPRGRRRGSRGLLRVVLLASTALMTAAVLAAASRAGQAALALMLVTLVLLRIGPWAAVLMAPLALPLALLSTRRTAEAAYSTTTRVRTMLNGYQAYLDHPLFGVGLDNYGRISDLNAHNSFILAATECGILGIGLFVLGVYLALKLLVKVWRWPRAEQEPASLEELRHLAAILLAMLVGVCSCITFESLSFDVMWLFPVGMLAAFYRVVQEEIPAFELDLHIGEILAALAVGALVPPVIVGVTTALVY
ncbi:MAG: hypothetical protein RMK29_11820 [Myxococcales bacterium]|nr:hypothetical protein [Myxococcota bacterium]MDW8282396.1 hypothetical protein [Myxococcales bacterium]